MILSPNTEYVKDMDDFQKASQLDSFTSLGLVDFYPLPHYTNFPFKKTVEKIIANYTGHIDLRPISNAQAIVVKGDKIEIFNK
jgi:dipeptidase E